MYYYGYNGVPAMAGGYAGYANGGYGYGAALWIVLFILLVIIIGAGWNWGSKDNDHCC